MPIWLRNFTFNEIHEFHEKQNSLAQKNQQVDSNELKGPDIDPTYKSKASKK